MGSEPTRPTDQARRPARASARLRVVEGAEAADTEPDTEPEHLEPAPVPGAEAFPADELRHDLLLAHISRCVDDREIALQKQSRVFFQISGAGHEALYLALAHELRAGYDWFFPYYRDQALVLGLGVSPTAILLQAVGSADDPSSAGRHEHTWNGTTTAGEEVPEDAVFSRRLRDCKNARGHSATGVFASLVTHTCSELKPAMSLRDNTG